MTEPGEHVGRCVGAGKAVMDAKATPTPGICDAGEAVEMSCFTCHPAGGEAREDSTCGPRAAGQPV